MGGKKWVIMKKIFFFIMISVFFCFVLHNIDLRLYQGCVHFLKQPNDFELFHDQNTCCSLRCFQNFWNIHLIKSYSKSEVE